MYFDIRPKTARQDLFNLDYALEHNALKYKELGATKEVKLDASKWLAGTGSAMTYTMGF